MGRVKGKRTADEVEDAPRCHLCQQSTDGQVYSFWGGYLVERKEIGSVLSNVSYVKSKYRSIRKCGVFVCETCAKRISRVGHLPWSIAFGLAFVVFAGGALAVSGGPPFLTWGLAILAALFGVCWLAYTISMISPRLHSGWLELLILHKVRGHLRMKGKGDEFFTEAEYRAMFKHEPSEAQSAEEILESAGIEDEEDARPR
jgi:hypothetical protein